MKRRTVAEAPPVELLARPCTAEAVARWCTGEESWPALAALYAWTDARRWWAQARRLTVSQAFPGRVA